MSDTGWVFDCLHLRILACMGGASCLQCVGHLWNSTFMGLLTTWESGMHRLGIIFTVCGTSLDSTCMGSASQKINVISVICTSRILGN